MSVGAGPATALPAAAAVVALAFAIQLFLRAARRRSLFEATWSIALLMFAVASAALALGVLDGWSTAEFRVYWLFGAVLNVPYLALGEVYLLARRPWIGHAALLVVLAATAWATGEVRTAPLDRGILSGETFFTGREALGEESGALALARIYSFAGYGLLLAGIAWSALGMRGRPELRGRFFGVGLIALGATVVAGGSAFAAAGSFAGFSLTLAAGVTVMYGGFLMVTRRGPAPRSAG